MAGGMHGVQWLWQQQAARQGCKQQPFACPPGAICFELALEFDQAGDVVERTLRGGVGVGGRLTSVAAHRHR